MKWEEWRFNLRFAWENRFLKFMSILILTTLIINSTISTVRLMQAGLSSGDLVTHYTVYLGIDQILPLPWLVLIVGVPIVLIFATIFFSFMLYRQDGIAGFALLALAGMSALFWSWHLYNLVKINI